MANGAFRSILFPIDFSHMSKTVASYVRGLAQATGANVTLLHVADHGNQNHQMRALELFRQQHFADSDCFPLVKEGAVAETITETAEGIGADLIMMPTYGLGRHRRFLIGSTAAKVLHDAHCAVWTSPHLYVLRPFTGFQHVLCTIDRNEVPSDFLTEAVRIARRFGGQLSFVTAMPSTIGGAGEERRVGSLAREYPQAGLHEDPTDPFRYEVYLETGPVGEVIRKLVEKESIDLVMTDRAHLRHPLGRLQTHIYEVVLASPCPVLSLCTAAKPVSAAEEHIEMQAVETRARAGSLKLRS